MSSECTNGWVCEHRWKEITNMIWFKNIVGSERIINYHWFNRRQFSFCRGEMGFIAFNSDSNNDFQHRPYVCVSPGQYCNIMSVDGHKNINNCKEVITVDQQRNADIFISKESTVGVVAIHLESALSRN